VHLPRPQTPSTPCLACASDAKTLFSAGEHNIVSIWDFSRSHRMDQFVLPAGTSFAMAFSPDGKRLACKLGGGAGISIWSFDAPGENLPSRREPRVAVLSPADATDDYSGKRIDLSDVGAFWNVGAGATCCKFSADGRV